jgi:nitrite reductase (NO-forming)
MKRLIGTAGVALVIAGGVVAGIAAPSLWRDLDQPAPATVVKATLLPPPRVPPPIDRVGSARVTIDLETTEEKGALANGVEYTFWTFGGTVPGPFLRVRVGDTVEITLRNSKAAHQMHSIDLHAVTGPGGGAAATQIRPGEAGAFAWTALNPGLYVYHCATPHVPIHVANGMYGLILVEPEKGLPRVDREYYVMEKGALTARAGETVRLFVGNGGPNLISSFHVIGEIFDRVYPEAAIGSEVRKNVQTTLIPAGGAAIVELTVELPGRFLLVDHSISRALDKGALGALMVSGADRPAIFRSLTPALATRPSGH